jgi:hypothetical protein
MAGKLTAVQLKIEVARTRFLGSDGYRQRGMFVREPELELSIDSRETDRKGSSTCWLRPGAHRMPFAIAVHSTTAVVGLSPFKNRNQHVDNPFSNRIFQIGETKNPIVLAYASFTFDNPFIPSISTRDAVMLRPA